jgi:hypothetical protein
MNFLGVAPSPNMTPAEKQLRPLLSDEAIHVLSTFELNQIASLTFNDLVCDEIFELIEKICSKPLGHTPLTIQKTLVVTKHILVYGQEKSVNHAYGKRGTKKRWADQVVGIFIVRGCFLSRCCLFFAPSNHKVCKIISRH